MTDKIHIMLDLETWGKKPGCDLRSIGACVFNPMTGFVHDGSLGSIRPFYIATDNPTKPTDGRGVPSGHFDWSEEKQGWFKYPLTRDPETVAWWSKQSDEAQAAFADPLELPDALRRFTEWLCVFAGFELGTMQDTLRLWSHGPAFDVPILAAAYDACKLPIPWHYRAPRDTRTAFDMAGVGDHSQFMQQFNHGTAHNALDDAISQARCVCAAYARLRDHHRQAFYDGWNSRDIASPSINAVGLSVHEAWAQRAAND